METLSLENQKSAGFSTYLAIGSFGIGTVLLLLHLYFAKDFDILLLGFFYVLFAILLNGITFLNLLFQFFIKPDEREDLAIKMLIMLANIPIALLYLYIVFHQF